jgi:hypothetical protein
MPGFRYTMSRPEKFSWDCAQVIRVGEPSYCAALFQHLPKNVTLKSSHADYAT